MRTRLTLLVAVLAVFASVVQAQTKATPAPSKAQVERGRYLVKITGCNDCHTAGYGQAAGKVPEKDWLQGDALGWQGPWGTTYATNLRLHFSRLSEAQWLEQARTMQARPPMPWFVFRDMREADLKAIYAYIRAAGPAGNPAPAYAPPGTAVQGPVARFPG
jgi:mono/diheme cytochrome c family protein